MYYHKEIQLTDYLYQACYGERVFYGTSHNETSGNWEGTNNWQSALHLVETGWTNGREFVDKIAAEVQTSMARLPVSELVWGVTGQSVDIAAYLMGDPECMVSWEERQREKNIVKILYNMTASAGVSSETMQWKGAMVVALIDRLETCGIRCEIDMMLASTNHGNEFTYVVHLKEASDPLYLDTVAFHLAHTAAFRRIMFAYMENDERAYALCSNSYGSPLSRSIIAERLTGYDITIPELNYTDLDECIKEVGALFDQVCPIDNPYHVGSDPGEVMGNKP